MKCDKHPKWKLPKGLRDGHCAPGSKYDGGKLRWGLLPVAPLQAIVRVLMFGAKKYADDNWKLVPNGQERYYEAMYRHATEWYAWKKGEQLFFDGKDWVTPTENDKESGLNHLAHAGACLVFLIWFVLNKKEK